MEAVKQGYSRVRPDVFVESLKLLFELFLLGPLEVAL